MTDDIEQLLKNAAQTCADADQWPQTEVIHQLIGYCKGLERSIDAMHKSLGMRDETIRRLLERNDDD